MGCGCSDCHERAIRLGDGGGGGTGGTGDGDSGVSNALVVAGVLGLAYWYSKKGYPS